MTKLKTEFTKLVRYYAANPNNPQAIVAIRSWFKYWDNENELAEKVLIWGRFFLPNYFRDRSPQFHLEMIKLNFSKQHEYFAAPRGFGKTTINQLCIMFSIVNNMEKFIVVIEKTFTEASEFLANIRYEFAENDRIKSFYGELVKKDKKGKLDDKVKDAQGDIFINGIRLRAKGFNQSVRGLKSREWRPTKIYCDDIEEDSHINSIDQREKYKDNYLKGVLPATDVDGYIKMVGTILHQDSLLSNLIHQHKGRVWRAYEVNNPDHTLLWPERWSIQRLNEKKEQMAIDGQSASKFSQEYLNMPVDDDKRPFKWEWLQKTYTQIPDGYNTFIAIDVADATGEKNDYTGVVVVCIDSQHNWYIKFAKRYRVSIEGLVDLIFQLWGEYNPIQIGVEKRAFDDQIKPLLAQKSDITGIFPIVEELKHKGDSKASRVIGALSGRFQGGKIFFAEGLPDDQKLLQGELYDFPRGQYDDLADALAYASNMAFKGTQPPESLPDMETYQYDSGLYEVDDWQKDWTDY